ncbi:MAG: YIP1 family protein [Maritimibacter sp.]|nr:YIP1 family protein [Maritimibacter sp.]
MKDIDWGYLFGMALQTVPEPRKVARDVFAFRAPRPVLWTILALELVSVAFLKVISSILFPLDRDELTAMFGEEVMATAILDPIAIGLILAAGAVAAVWMIYAIGRRAGGHGSFDQALLTMIWLVFVLLNLQLIIVVLTLFAPGLALLLAVLSFAMSFWLASHFIAEMHGFSSAGVVFVGILMVLLVVAVALSFVLALLGFGGAVEPGPGGA